MFADTRRRRVGGAAIDDVTMAEASSSSEPLMASSASATSGTDGAGTDGAGNKRGYSTALGGGTLHQYADGTPKLPRTAAEMGRLGRRLIVVIEGANLEVVKAGSDYQLLNCDDHKHIIGKTGRSLADCRPDITHSMLLALLDSPLNKAGMLQVYIHTAKNVLIEVNPQIRIPRTFRRFAGLMVQLLKKLKVRASGGNQPLMKVIQNPISSHLPSGCRKIGASYCANKLVDLQQYVPTLPSDAPIVFVIGGIAHGDIKEATSDFCEEYISFSEYPLSAQVACSRLLTTVEQHWGVL